MSNADADRKEPTRSQDREEIDEKWKKAMIFEGFNAFHGSLVQYLTALANDAVHFKVKAVSVGNHLSVWKDGAEIHFIGMLKCMFISTFNIVGRTPHVHEGVKKYTMSVPARMNDLTRVLISGGSHHGQEPILVIHVTMEAAAEMRSLLGMPAEDDGQSPFICPSAKDEGKRGITVICEPHDGTIAKLWQHFGHVKVGPTRDEPLLKHINKERAAEILFRALLNEKVSDEERTDGPGEVPTAEVHDAGN